MRPSVVVLLVLCSSSFIHGQSSQDLLTRGQMQADFDGLVSALKEAHGGLYRYNKPQGLDGQFSACRNKLPASATVLQFGSIVSEITALMRDGHNRLEYDDATQATLRTAPLLPLQFAIENGNLVVLYNDTPTDHTILPGMEIVSVNGRSTAPLLAELLTKVSGDGFIETGKIRRLERSLSAYYWLYADQSSVFEITARGSDGKAITTKLSGVVSASRLSNRTTNPVNATILQNGYLPGTQKKNVSLTFRNDIALLAIRGFEGGPFTEQLDSVFVALRKKGTTKLVLDLRGNGGGVDMEGAYLVACLTDKPFRYFDHIEMKTINPSFTRFKESTSADLKDGTVRGANGGYRVTARLHPGVGLQQPAPTPFLGKLVVLIDGGSFSTTADVCAVLRNLNRATFVGEETGGAAEGNTSGTNATYRFPNSGLKLRISLYGYWNAVKCTPGRGTIPDVAVDRKVNDLLSKVDRQLLAGLEWLKSR